MTRLRYCLLFLFALLILVRPGSGCSFEEDDTPTHIDPDKPYAAYVGGRLGIVSGELRVRHLVVAYNTLSGRGLTPTEKKAAIDVDRFYNYGGGFAPEQISEMWSYSDKPRITGGAAAWFRAVPQSPTRVEHTVRGDEYETFFNCLDDAYAHAASTLADRRARYNRPGQPDTPEIKDWIQGQLAVFSNCSDLKPRQSFAPNAPPPPPACAGGSFVASDNRNCTLGFSLVGELCSTLLVSIVISGNNYPGLSFSSPIRASE